MKVVVIVLTTFAMLSAVYFLLSISSLAQLASQQLRRFPPSGPFGLPAFWDLDAYTERGKELVLRMYRAMLFAGLAIVASLVCFFVAWPAVSGRPLVTGKGGLSFELGVQLIILSTATVAGLLGFVGSSVWLLVVIIGGRRNRAEAARAGIPASPVYRQRMLTCLKWMGWSLLVFVMSIAAPIAAKHLGS